MKIALDNREVTPGLIVHSHRGSQYRSNDYAGFLEKHDVQRSKSRKGNSWSNAEMVSFYSRLKVVLIYAKNHQSIDEARSAIFACIEVF